MQYDFISVGDVTTDSFIKLKEGVHTEPDDAGVGTELCFRFGDKLEYEQVDVVHGVGNAGNAAVCAARLGLKTALVTDIGTDNNGDAALAAWRNDTVSDEYVRRHDEYPTHSHFVLRFGAERTILIKHQPWPYALPAFNEPPRWIYFTSTGEHGEPYHHEIAKYVKESGAKLAFQPGTFQIALGAKKIKDVYEASEVFFCNKEEAHRILETKDGNIHELLKAIRALGPNIAVITDGPNGAYASDSSGTWFVPMYPDPAPPVDRTGAGDATASTITALLASGETLEAALARGPINSMNVVQYIGGQEGLLAREKLEDLLKQAPADYTVRQIA
jgi:sugar/nucleoside kinase (ribokinase family)